MGETVEFPTPKKEPDPLEKVVARINRLARKSEVIFLCPHAKEQMLSRGISVRQVLDVLRNGKGIDGPELDTYGDYRVKLRRFSAGKTIRVIVAEKKDCLEVVTVF